MSWLLAGPHSTVCLHKGHIAAAILGLLRHQAQSLGFYSAQSLVATQLKPLSSTCWAAVKMTKFTWSSFASLR